MEIDVFLSRIQLKPNWYFKMVLDHYVPLNMVSTCQIWNIFDQSVSTKCTKSTPILASKTGSSTAIYKKKKAKKMRFFPGPKVKYLVIVYIWVMMKLFPPNRQNCTATSKLPLSCGIPQSAPEHWESSRWGGQKPYQGCVLNSIHVCGPVPWICFICLYTDGA